jgi:hypothetical protein
MSDQLDKFELLNELDHVHEGQHVVDSAEIAPGKVFVSYWESMPIISFVFVVLKAPKDGIFQIAFLTEEGWCVGDNTLAEYGISLNPGAKSLDHETDQYLFVVPGFDPDTFLPQVKAAINASMGYGIV